MTARSQKLECLICGATFTLEDAPDGYDEIPDLRRFLSRHRRCLQRLIERGGTFARLVK
jgi:hypothetical protein